LIYLDQNVGERLDHIAAALEKKKKRLQTIRFVTSGA
jgi:predicted transcriptional regulator